MKLTGPMPPYEPFDPPPPGRLWMFLHHPNVKATVHTAMLFAAAVVGSAVVPMLNTIA